MEFTPEQEEYIENLVNDRTKDLFTEDELNRRVTSEVDRRVESGIQKGLETHKAKWEEEYQNKAKLTAEELAQQEYNQKLEELSDKERELSKRANTIEAMDMLSGAEIPKDRYEGMLELLVSDDIDKTTNNVTNYIDSFNETKKEIESRLKKELSNIPPPSVGDNPEGGITKKQFSKMSYGERLELKQKDEDLYNKLTK